MTADAVEDVWSCTRLRDWTWADLQEIPDYGHRYELARSAGRDVATVSAGSVSAGSVSVVGLPFRVELRPAELVGPRPRA